MWAGHDGETQQRQDRVDALTDFGVPGLSGVRCITVEGHGLVVVDFDELRRAKELPRAFLEEEGTVDAIAAPRSCEVRPFRDYRPEIVRVAHLTSPVTRAFARARCAVICLVWRLRPKV